MTQAPAVISTSGSRTMATHPDSALVSEHGTTVIADSVVAKIAGIAARDISGVHALGGGASRAVSSLRERIPGQKTSVAQGVSVTVAEQEAAVEVSVIADYGVAIADLAQGIRANIISAVERMTGMTVTAVDVSVLDVYLPEDDDESDQQQ